MTDPIRYIDRTRRYYQALGYGAPYRWARFETVPFARPQAPLEALTVAVVTTAAPVQPDKGDQGPGAPYNAAAKFYTVYETASSPIPDLRISHIAIDRDHTSAADPGSYLPLAALADLARQGQVRAAEVVFGLPTNRSHRASATDADDLTRRALAHGIDAAVLVPNCPVCHQSVSFAARALEAAGIATVILGAARDIPEHVGVPRLVFSDVPLGNAAGCPGDPVSQRDTLALGLRLLREAEAPRSTWVNPMRWPGPPDWRSDYSNPDKLSADEIARRRAAFDAGKAEAKTLRTSQST